MAAVFVLAADVSAQLGSHARRVSVGNGKWVTPDEAQAQGYMLYRERWLPKKLHSKLKRWERQDAKVRGWRDAYRVKSKHYRIRTNAPRFLVELEIKPFLDELYRTYVQVFRQDFGLRGKAADKHQIEIYWGFATWRDEQDRNRANPGFYEQDGTLHVLYDETDPDSFHNTVFHEGAHQFFAALLPGANFPVWLDEALATYFEGFSYSSSAKKVTQNHLPLDRLEDARFALNEAKQAGAVMMPAEMFMGRSCDDFHADHYALAWSYVHYLIHRDGGKHKKEFARFLAAMNGSGAKSVARVYREATRRDLAEIDAGWVDYVFALEAPPCRERHILAPSFGGSGEEIAAGDRLIMVNGHEIESLEDLERHWEDRDKSHPATVVVLRKFDQRGPQCYEQEYVKIEVAANSDLELISFENMTYPKNFLR